MFKKFCNRRLIRNLKKIASKPKKYPVTAGVILAMLSARQYLESELALTNKYGEELKLFKAYVDEHIGEAVDNKGTIGYKDLAGSFILKLFIAVGIYAVRYFLIERGHIFTLWQTALPAILIIGMFTALVLQGVFIWLKEQISNPLQIPVPFKLALKTANAQGLLFLDGCEEYATDELKNEELAEVFKKADVKDITTYLAYMEVLKEAGQEM